jgi:transcriptional regulator with XRE-family HTH domain
VTISERIFDVLKRSGKKQADLAKHVGVRSNTVSDWKNKGINPSADLIPKIAEFLGVSCDYLLTGKEHPGISASNIHNSAVVQGNHATTLIVKNGKEEGRELSDQEVELLRIFNLLDVKRQTALLSYAYKLEDECQQE